MVDIKGSLAAGKMSMIAMLALWIVITVLGIVAPMLNLLGLLQFFVLNPLLLAYAGFVATKKMNMDLVGGVLAGALSGIVVSVVTGIMQIIMVAVGLGSLANNSPLGGTSGASTAAIGAVLLVATVIGAVFMVGVLAVGGAICGAIGGYIGARK
ncbi:hypothetical protein FJZ26_05710 [Candidatus Parvarchaeota archaeon]|nr:hypothetical protein [Candidatus Parvarchaeota archaeon]